MAIFERLHDYVEGGGGHHALDERGGSERCFNKCFLHYILDLMFWHHSHDFSPLRVIITVGILDWAYYVSDS